MLDRKQHSEKLRFNSFDDHMRVTNLMNDIFVVRNYVMSRMRHCGKNSGFCMMSSVRQGTEASITAC